MKYRIDNELYQQSYTQLCDELWNRCYSDHIEVQLGELLNKQLSEQLYFPLYSELLDKLENQLLRRLQKI